MMEQALLKKRHSLSHILAQAVQREQQRDVEVAIGPAIDNGFYYDFLFSSEKQIKEEDLKKIQNQMEKIVKENQDFVLFSLSDAESKKLVTELMKQQYKEEMRSEFAAAGEEITFYANTIVEGAKAALLKGIICRKNFLKSLLGSSLLSLICVKVRMWKTLKSLIPRHSNLINSQGRTEEEILIM